MSDVLTPDICVIGAGSGGLSAAMAAAAFGVPVVLIEKAKIGDDYLNTGSVPSKALVAVARRAELLRRPKPFILDAQEPTVDFHQVRDHIRGVVTALAPNNSAERVRGLGVNVIQGTARFKDRRTVAVGNEVEIKARRFIIATGSSAAIPTIPGLEQASYLTEETIFQLRACPKHLVVIGAGSRGLELAQAYRRLGAEVTVLEAAQPFSGEDPECAAIVLDQLAREGVCVRAGVQILRVKRAKSKVQIVIAGASGEEKIEATHLLVAAGRKPNVEELDLAAAGIACEPGAIVVDGKLRTTNKKVYALGDVVGVRATHAAQQHAALIIRNALFRLPARANKKEISRVTYTEPELAQVGLTEAEARHSHRTVRILRWPYRENDRAQAEKETKGHIKVLTTKRGKILGATIVGAQAGELITAWTLAISQEMNIRALADLVVASPTLGEIGKRAAISYFTPGLARPWLRRTIAILRLLG
jgi:pyruvate/2-oxoglutarate dehydrogenase complex dihydrolipoamide dehydrogenase (E3) component